MTSINEAVLAYFQGFDPLAFAVGAVIGLSLIYGIPFLRARWNDKNRLIEQLRADNDAQQQLLADLHSAIFGGYPRPFNVVTRHRMVVRSLHEVIHSLPNRNSVVNMLIATDDYLRNILAAALGMTLEEYDHNPDHDGRRSGFGYEGTYRVLQSLSETDVAPRAPASPVTCPVDARGVWEHANIEFWGAMLKGAEEALASIGVSLGSEHDFRRAGQTVLAQWESLADAEHSIVATAIRMARYRHLYPKLDEAAIVNMTLDDPDGYAIGMWRSVFQALAAQRVVLGVTDDELRERAKWRRAGEAFADNLMDLELSEADLVGSHRGDILASVQAETRKKIGEVTITKIDEPAGEWPEVTHVRYTYTGDLTEQSILKVVSELDDDTAASSGSYDPKERRGGYALIDACSRLSVGQVLEVFEQDDHDHDDGV